MATTRGEREPGSDWLIWLLLVALAALFVWWLGSASEATILEEGDVAAAIG